MVWSFVEEKKQDVVLCKRCQEYESQGGLHKQCLNTLKSKVAMQNKNRLKLSSSQRNKTFSKCYIERGKLRVAWKPDGKQA